MACTSLFSFLCRTIAAYRLFVWYVLVLGRVNLTAMTLRRYFSNGCPFFSYMANRNHGTITRIIKNAAALIGMYSRSRKKSGSPMTAAEPKHTICRLVRPSANLVFTRVRSFGIDT